MAVDAQYFIDHSVSADQASLLADEHNAMLTTPAGKGPMILPSAPTAPTAAQQSSQGQAQAEYDALLADRTAGKFNEYDWRTVHEPRMQQLIAQLTAQSVDHFDKDITAAYAPARSTVDYLFPQAPDDESRAQDTAIGEAMLSAQVPAHVGRNLITDVVQFGEKLNGRTPEDAQKMISERVSQVRAGLMSAWGESFQANLDQIDEFAEKMMQKTPASAAGLQRILPLLSASNLIELSAWLTAKRV